MAAGPEPSTGPSTDTDTDTDTATDLPPPTFDLDTYANNYDGALLPFRLAHIALHCSALAPSAVRLAIGTAKRGKDVRLYARLTELAGSRGPSELATVDAEWASRKDEENRREQTRLESELRGYKNNLIRESIRMGQEDLARHLLDTGGPMPDPSAAQPAAHTSGYSAAYQAFGRMRDYCTTPSHMNGMQLRLVYTAILQAVSTLQQGGSPNMQWNSVLVNAGRLRNAGVREEEQFKLTPISFVVSGIAHMGLGDYQMAAESFLHAPFTYHNLGPIHGDDFEKKVANANDVAVFGGLCALATMTREDLVEVVLGGPFRQFLELEPHMRKAISLYTTAKYQSCIDTLGRYYSDWRLDIFLGASVSPRSRRSHVDLLLAKIRERSITAYFSSFSEVSLSSLASTFPPTSTSPDAMEVEALGMIENGTLEARLDVVKGLLVAPQKDLRAETHRDARLAAEEVERTMLLRLHRVNMTLAGLDIPKAGRQWDPARNGY